jgi:hypothetical protein
MHRWFNVEAAEADLKFEPIIGFGTVLFPP